jgi:hypothetical protein
MGNVEDILEQMKRLKPEELLLLMEQLTRFLTVMADEKRPRQKGPKTRMLALSGKARSASADVSSRKGKHLADADASTRVENIIQLRLSLEGIRPPIWRRIQVPDGFTLAQLHTVIQLAMDWQDCHLHQFSVGDRRYGPPDPESDDPELLDERKVHLRDLKLSIGNRIGYTYDFGDNWEHVLVIEETQVPRPEVFYPVCLDGKRAAPPEDVGGEPGYEEFLKAIADPKHEQHGDMIEWIGGPFDSDAFQLDQINQGLSKSFRPRKKA